MEWNIKNRESSAPDYGGDRRRSASGIDDFLNRGPWMQTPFTTRLCHDDLPTWGQSPTPKTIHPDRGAAVADFIHRLAAWLSRREVLEVEA
jgi:hypothetical protein